MIASFVTLLISSVIVYFFYRNIKSIRKINREIVIISLIHSVVIGLSLGFLIWSVLKSSNQRFSEFISGNVVFNYSTKSADYFGIYSGILSFLISYLLILKINLFALANGISNAILIHYSKIHLFPFCIMLGQCLLLQNCKNLLIISLFSIFIYQGLILLITLLAKHSIIDLETIKDLYKNIILIIIFGIFSIFGIALLFNRLGILGLSKEIAVFYTSFSLILLIVLLLTKVKFHKIIDVFSLSSQLGLPLLFLVLLSPPVRLDNGTQTFFKFKFVYYLLIITFILINYANIINNSFFAKNRKRTSVWSICAILVYLSTNVFTWPSINADDFHAGEFYLPWWLFEEFQQIPFLDYQPARGLINYIPGIFSKIFFDNTFSGQSITNVFLFSISAIIAFFIIRLWINDLYAFLITLTLAGSGILFNFHLAFIFGFLVLYLLNKSSITNFKKLCIIFFGLPIIWLFQIAEGSAVIMSLLPISLFIFIDSWIHERKKLIYFFILMLAIIILLYLVAPEIIMMFYSAVRYLLEQGGVNDVAYGIPWRPTSTITQGLLWEFIRFSWLFLLILVLYLIIHYFDKFKRDNKFKLDYHFSFLIAIIIIIIILIPRSAGRVDPNAHSRPFIASSFLMTASFPILIFPWLKRHKTNFLLVFSIIIGLLGNQEFQVDRLLLFPKQILTQPENTVSGIPINGVGEKVIMDQAQLQRQLAIKEDLDYLLSADETFLDLTNHNSDYGFQNRENPIPTTSFYNIPSKAEQVRSVDDLKKAEIPLVLISSDNILHDGGTLPLRSFWIYHYLIDNYYPFKGTAENIWMIQKDQIDRLNDSKYHLGSFDEQLNLLETAFSQIQLYGLPSSWGESITSLENELIFLEDIFISENPVIKNGSEIVETRINNIGSTEIRILFSENMNYVDFLYIELNNNDCNGSIDISFGYPDKEKDNINAFTFAQFSEKYLIPLSASPRWILETQIREVIIDFNITGSCEFSIDKIELYKRNTQ